MDGDVIEESSERLLGNSRSSDSEWVDGSEVDWEVAPWTVRSENENREGIGTIRRRLMKKPKQVDSFDVEAMEIAGNHGYRIKWILHDWSNEHCLKLLKNCYKAIPDDGKAIVMEAVFPVIPEASAAMKSVSQMDVLMMTQSSGGKERSEQEFMELATTVGFKGIKYECFVYNFWIMEFFK